MVCGVVRLVGWRRFVIQFTSSLGDPLRRLVEKLKFYLWKGNYGLSNKQRSEVVAFIVKTMVALIIPEMPNTALAS